MLRSFDEQIPETADLADRRPCRGPARGPCRPAARQPAALAPRPVRCSSVDAAWCPPRVLQVPFSPGLSKAELRKVLKSSLAGVEKQLGGMYKRMAKHLTADDLLPSLWDKAKVNAPRLACHAASAAAPPAAARAGSPALVWGYGWRCLMAVRRGVCVQEEFLVQYEELEALLAQCYPSEQLSPSSPEMRELFRTV